MHEHTKAHCNNVMKSKYTNGQKGTISHRVGIPGVLTQSFLMGKVGPSWIRLVFPAHPTDGNLKAKSTP